MTLTFEQIKQRFQAEQATPVTPMTKADMPPTYESITPQWLTDVLANGVPGAKVESHVLGPHDDGTSNRRKIAVRWNEAGRQAGLPDKLFCKGTQSLESRYMLGMNEGVQAEVNFYNVLQQKIDVISPPKLFARYDPATLNSIVVLKDLSDEVAFCTMETDLSFEHCRSQMSLLATLHSTFHESPLLETELNMFSKWETFFRITAFDAGFEDSCIRGFTQAEEVIPPRLFAREAEVWPATLKCVDLHETMPRGMTHNDVHLKNWFIRADGEMGINDWQNSAQGNGSRDLAYCISTAVVPEKRREWERDLLRYYIEEFAARGGPKLDFDVTFRRYRQQLFAALAWWSGTLGQPPDAPAMQPRDTSLEFIRRTTVAIDDLDALDSFE
tara:strand:+ start:1215 stop:2369 length:1155 start_codon:yes stop_codon:yes gene_type:complete